MVTRHGGDLAEKKVLETLATVLRKTDEHIVAMCSKRLLYYFNWRGTGVYKDLIPGDVVRVHHTEGFYPEVFAVEAVTVRQGSEEAEDE